MTVPVVFPAQAAESDTCLVVDPTGPGLPVVRWVGVGIAASDATAVAAGSSGTPLLIEHSTGRFGRPGLRGHRIDGDSPGSDWSTAFEVTSVDVADRALVIEATDALAGLSLRTEVESLTGGALRARHILTNDRAGRYLLDGLEVTFPLPDNAVELLDFTGRHERERTPQREPVRDGLWLRESRRGRPGLDSPSMVIAGPAGFGFADGDVVGVHLAWSGNSVLRVERDGATGATIGGGELLLPGELTLDRGESYETPWLVVVAAEDGLDSLAAVLHTWSRSLPAHPSVQSVTLNVWEAVYFDHDLDRLSQLAELGARIGVERFVLDDGWFRGRRSDDAGLGDWTVDPLVWPKGLRPLSDRVHELGLQFGLWIEPEMVNPNSDVYRAHPDWVLAAVDGRVPLLQRNQLVLDLTNPAAWQYLHDTLDTLLTEQDVDAIKWDHNRDLLEAGSPIRGGAPAVHEQTLAFYGLIDALAARHPSVDWESCASGGGRIDLRVIERVQRFWTSDMTDALSRQQIQRWTGQLVPPEYLGAHVSAPRSHQTGRTLSLDFRAATALFGAFGIEWDLTAAAPDDLVSLTEWVDRYKRFRPLLHTGRVVRIESSDPAVLLHGVLATDRRSGLLAHVQLDESAHNRGVSVRVPGLQPDVTYHLTWEGSVDRSHLSVAPGVPLAGPTAGEPLSGAVLARVGFTVPRRHPETILLIRVEQSA